jgi:hypothetical protein
LGISVNTILLLLLLTKKELKKIKRFFVKFKKIRKSLSIILTFKTIILYFAKQ